MRSQLLPHVILRSEGREAAEATLRQIEGNLVSR